MPTRPAGASVRLVAVLVVGASFTLLMYRSLFQVYREMDEERRRLLLTRALPMLLVVVAVQATGAVAGAVTGHGALVGLIVMTVALMSVAMAAIVVLSVVKGIRGSQDRT